jgi:hypothetical protein
LLIARTGLTLTADRVGSDVRLTFPTLAGKNYHMDYTAMLPPSIWSILAPSVTGTGAQVTITDLGAISQAARFYRVVRLD